jgi:hypothetical protein
MPLIPTHVRFSNMHVTNAIPLGESTALTVAIINHAETVKAAPTIRVVTAQAALATANGLDSGAATLGSLFALSSLVGPIVHASAQLLAAFLANPHPWIRRSFAWSGVDVLAVAGIVVALQVSVFTETLFGCGACFLTELSIRWCHLIARSLGLKPTNISLIQQHASRVSTSLPVVP